MKSKRRYMNAIKIIITGTVLFLLVPVITSFGQNESEFWKKVRIRKAFDTETVADEKPATASLTLPDSGDAHYLINVGIGYAIDEKLSIFALFNRNTLIDEEQHNFKSGFTGDFKIINRNSTFAFLTNTTIEYMRNYIDTTHNGLFTSYWYPWSKVGLIKLGDYANRNDAVTFYLKPQVGVEWQQTFESNSEAKKGYDVRVFYGLGLNLLFRKQTQVVGLRTSDSPGLFQTRNQKQRNRSETGNRRYLELKVGYEGRSSAFNDREDIEKYNPLFRAEVQWYPFETENFNLGISYYNGANPVEGIARQEYFAFTINFKN